MKLSFGGDTHFDVRKKERDGAGCAALIVYGWIGTSVVPPGPELSTTANQPSESPKAEALHNFVPAGAEQFQNT